ncbi:MAG: DoxX family protein [Alphaproteobacteria bacterium CG_4_9_14_3_um_filter_47_13]|nr:MAG: DoxX family protein [Alphaproteobacteria bacterium CG_4_9_14_3_um_filter_47_13]
MKSFLLKADHLIEPLRHIADKFATPLLYLGLRLYVAEDFFRSGWGRLKDYLNGSWETQLFLFGMEHPVPGLDPALAAPVTMVAELILPVLLVFGLLTRLGAAGLFMMALIIQLTYLEHFQHIVWMTMMAVIFVKGAGVISFDYLLLKWIKKEKEIENEPTENCCAKSR